MSQIHTVNDYCWATELNTIRRRSERHTFIFECATNSTQRAKIRITDVCANKDNEVISCCVDSVIVLFQTIKQGLWVLLKIVINSTGKPEWKSQNYYFTWIVNRRKLNRIIKNHSRLTFVNRKPCLHFIINLFFLIAERLLRLRLLQFSHRSLCYKCSVSL